MSPRVRMRLLLVSAVVAIAAAVFGVSQLQRSSKAAAFEEYRSVVDLRLAALALEQAGRDLGTGGIAARAEFEKAAYAVDAALREARERRDEREEIALVNEQERLLDGYVAGASVPGERPDRGKLDAFLSSNDLLLRKLAEKRRDDDRRTAVAPVLVVLGLSLVFGLLHLLLVERSARRARRAGDRQDEFALAMQVARSEQEAYEVLARHVRRSAGARHVTVLNRNNSADRLEAATPVEPGSALAGSLEGAQPSSCLAVRLAGPHEAGAGADALIRCEVCGEAPGRTTCVPSLVGGEVIGSVLLEHDRRLADPVRTQLAASVAAAAPVIANLRNLAIAELRAATDNLTGLPNQRSVHEALKRMAAQAGRTLEPLSAVLFDLDRFKAINDTYGHGKGDEVLAAVSAAAAATIRTSDFVGRLGGEEFVALLPSTDRCGAIELAEKLRAAIAQIQVAGVDRPITASFGVATLPEEAGEPDGLLRMADRALYTAKSQGRDRVATLVAA